MQGCPAPTLLLGSLPPFGDVRIGTSASNYFTISNPTGCSVNYSVSGGGYGFSISAPGTTIPAQGSVSVYVTFSPNAEQYYSGTANVNVSGSGTGGAVSFSGHGVR